MAPAQGVLLVARPAMPDPRFSQAVVLLLEHGADGTLGVIINRSTNIPLARAVPDLEVPGKEGHRLYFGGPVALSTLLFLIRSEDPPAGARNVITDVYYSADRATLEGLLTRRAGSDTLRLFAGHSGWAPGQLDSEIAAGDWSLVAGEAGTVFDTEVEAIWPDLIDRLPPPGLFIQAPAGPAAITTGLQCKSIERSDSIGCPETDLHRRHRPLRVHHLPRGHELPPERHLVLKDLRGPAR